MAVDNNNSQKYNDNSEDLLKKSDSADFIEEKELEKYGVWVKTGPEEIDDLDESSDYNLSDLEEESIITDEEEIMLGELEKELSDENTDLELNISELEDVELEDLTTTSESPESLIEEPVEEETFDIDIDFDDDLNEIEELAADNSIDLSTEESTDIQNLEELENIDLDDLELEDLELEDLEIEETQAPAVTSDDELTDNEISLDDMDDLDLDMDILLEEDETEIPDILNTLDETPEDLLLEDEIEITDFSENLDELEEVSETASGNPDVSQTIPDIDKGDDFDETEKIIEDLTEFDDLDEPSFSDNDVTDQKSFADNLEPRNEASEILKKIELELLSIKNELHDVKQELSILRPDNSPLEEAKEEKSQVDDSGFFEEVEDETIALTGDELDNILNTADITEETGSESESPDDILEFDNPDDILDTDDLLVESEDIIVIEDDDSISTEDESNFIDELDVNEEIDLEDDLLTLEIDEEPAVEDLHVDPIDEIIEEDINEDILLTDLETEDFNLDTLEISDISEEIEIDNDDSGLMIEEIEEVNLEEDQFEEELIPEVASEPDATSVIDMELPEMQEESLGEISPHLKTEIKSVLSYMDQLLESLPDEKIDEFANSEHYEVYKKLFEELGLN